MKVLFIEPPEQRRVGGIETALAGMARGLSEAGVIVSRRDTATDRDLSSADLVHFHGLWEPAHRRLRRRCVESAKPFLVSPHGMLEPWAFRHRAWKKWPYFLLWERPSLRRSHGLLATSSMEAEGLQRWFAKPGVHTLPLGITGEVGPDYVGARSQLGWRKEEKIVVFLSRLDAKKGLHLLVEAWTSLPRAGCRLVIVGQGADDYVAPLKAISRNDPSIEWIGARWGDAKWPYLQGADLVCLPSFSENFGLAVLEALLVGSPVLTTPFTPWGELGAGLPVALTAPESASIQQALRRFFDSGGAAPDRAETHRRVCARFSWSSLAKDYRQLYDSLVTSPTHAR